MTFFVRKEISPVFLIIMLSVRFIFNLQLFINVTSITKNQITKNKQLLHLKEKAEAITSSTVDGNIAFGNESDHIQTTNEETSLDIKVKKKKNLPYSGSHSFGSLLHLVFYQTFQAHRFQETCLSFLCCLLCCTDM